ncbi:MAG: type II secretion system F family protein [Pseudomonadota bacterium]
MTVFRYRAADALGRVLHGEATAASEQELERRLARVGLEMLVASEPRDRLPVMFRRHRLRPREQINLFLQLESLLRAGVPLLDALADLRDAVSNYASRQIATDLIDRIETGSSLSEAMAAQSAVSDPRIVGLLRTGEISGRMPDVLRDIVASLQWQDDLHTKMRKALRYPTFVAVVIFAVIGFLMVYLVPQLSQFLAGMGRELPLQTRALLATSDFIVRGWPVLLCLPVATWFVARIALARSASLRLWRDGMLLRIPLVGDVLRKISLARFANTFALMFGSGIPVLDALGHCESAVGNLAISDGLARVRTLVAQGSPVSDAFAALQVFPSFVVRMVKVGERTGQLDVSLRNVSQFFTRDVDEQLDRLQSMIEPVLTLIMGVLLGWVMIAVLGPVYDTISAVQS